MAGIHLNVSVVSDDIKGVKARFEEILDDLKREGHTFTHESVSVEHDILELASDKLLAVAAEEPQHGTVELPQPEPVDLPQPEPDQAA